MLGRTYLCDFFSRLVQRIETHTYEAPGQHDVVGHDADGFHAVAGEVERYQFPAGARPGRRSATRIQNTPVIITAHLQITPPAQLLDEVVLELLARDADLEVAQAGDLDGLGERGVGLEQGGRLEVGRPLLGLLQVLRLGPQVDDRLDPVRLLQAPPVRGRGVICFTCPTPRGQRWWSL